MVAFLVLLYTIYLAALVICGIFLRIGLFPGPAPVSMTIVPAALAGVALSILFLISLIPADFERVVARWAQGHRRVRLARRIASIPATIATRHAHGAVAPAPPEQRPAGGRRRGGFLGREHRGAVGVLPRVRRGRPDRPCWCRASSSA